MTINPSGFFTILFAGIAEHMDAGRFHTASQNFHDLRTTPRRLSRILRAGKNDMKAITLFVLACTLAANGQQHAIDKQKSVMTVHVSRSGVFSALGHDHEIAAP